MKLSEFSDGYYYAPMDVQEYDDGPVICTPLYDFIQRNLYDETDADIILRVGLSGPHITVTSERGVPTDVLALPPEMVAEQGQTAVFILKQEYSEILGDY